jgi:hypothetical protein
MPLPPAWFLPQPNQHYSMPNTTIGGIIEIVHLAVVAVFALPFGPAQADDLDQPETQAELCQKGVLFESLESGGS